MGFWQGQSWLARLSLSCKCPPSPVGSQSSMGGLSAGHSCFPFLLNHTAAIWTRLSPHNTAELLCRPRLSLSRQAWPSEPRPLPSAPVPDPLSPSSLLLPLLRGPAVFRSWTRHMSTCWCVCVCVFVCVCVCVCMHGGSPHSYTPFCVCAAYATGTPLMSQFNTRVSEQKNATMMFALYSLSVWHP